MKLMRWEQNDQKITVNYSTGGSPRYCTSVLEEVGSDYIKMKNGPYIMINAITFIEVYEGKKDELKSEPGSPDGVRKVSEL